MIRTVIIEDESAAQKLLSTILLEYCPEIKIVGFGTDVKGSVLLIEEKKPDLIFMDIELVGGNSFQILENLRFRSFKLIFTTAYDEYALKAFHYEAIDYIVKPYSPSDIRKAINRIDQMPKYNARYNTKGNNNNGLENIISISTEDTIEFIEINRIVRVEADRSYCILFLDDESQLTISKPLKDIEDELPPQQFFRTHQSHIINFNFVSKYIKEDGGMILLKNGKTIPLARRRKQTFLEQITR